MGLSIDREKVIKGLRCCSHTDGVNCIYCPYDNIDSDCTALMSMDVLELLKEQEAVKPEREHSGGGTTWWNVCGACRTAINPNDKFCHECGRAVKWE